MAVRMNNPELARSSLAAARAFELTDDEEAALAEEFTHVSELVEG